MTGDAGGPEKKSRDTVMRQLLEEKDTSGADGTGTARASEVAKTEQKNAFHQAFQHELMSTGRALESAEINWKLIMNEDCGSAGPVTGDLNNCRSHGLEEVMDYRTYCCASAGIFR